MTKKCFECNRVFDLTYELDAEELAYGHDCEEPMTSEYWGYVFEIRALKAMPEDANVRNEEMTLESGSETPAERLNTIQMIFDQEGWDWPEHLI